MRSRSPDAAKGTSDCKRDFFAGQFDSPMRRLMVFVDEEQLAFSRTDAERATSKASDGNAFNMLPRTT